MLNVFVDIGPYSLKWTKYSRGLSQTSLGLGLEIVLGLTTPYKT